MELKRVVITGLGALTPIGNTAPEYWEALTKGVSGAAPITRFDASKFKTRFACEVKNFNIQDHLDRKEALQNGSLRSICHGCGRRGCKRFRFRSRKS